MSNQSDRQASARTISGTALTYEGDFHAVFDAAGVAAGPFNGRMIAWINSVLGTSYTDINGAQAAFAVNQGVADWNSLGAFSVGPAPTLLGEDGATLLGEDGATLTGT